MRSQLAVLHRRRERIKRLIMIKRTALAVFFYVVKDDIRRRLPRLLTKSRNDRAKIESRLPRLFQSALLRRRYEGLSPSGVSVNGVRNDNINRRALRCSHIGVF